MQIIRSKYAFMTCENLFKCEKFFKVTILAGKLLGKYVTIKVHESTKL